MDTLSPPPIKSPPASKAAANEYLANVVGGDEIHGDKIIGNKIVGFTADQVHLLLVELRTSYQPKPFDGRSPYVGLASFQEYDADRFYGREQLTQQLARRVADSGFVVIAGPSGSGKSSLARAGLMAALKRGALPGSEHWLYEILTPGRHPLDALGRAIDNLKDLNAGDDLRRLGRTDETRLHRWLNAALGDDRTRRVVLLIDQFEECFTQCTEEAERAAFFDLLTSAATVTNGRVTIVCTTRSDFIGNWAAYPNLNAQLGHGLNQIPPLQPFELFSAIARPAIRVGLQIDDALVKQVLDDMRDAPGALPLMQFALDDLFNYAQSKGGVIALTRDDYLERGGLQQALARHADAEFAKLSEDEQHIARSIFAHLIEPGRGNVDTKRTALFQELVPTGDDPAKTRQVLGKLADARLVTTDKVNQRETITLAHERLIDAWGWLRRLVDENREAMIQQNQIAEDAQAWEQHKRDASYLYTGARLATAQERARDKKITIGALEQEFVSAGKRRHRLTRIAVAASLLLGTVVIATISTLAITNKLNELIYRPLPMQFKMIPAGDFIMGSTADQIKSFLQECDKCDFSNEKSAHLVYLDAFRINQFEITNREYQQCKDARVCDSLNTPQATPENANYPVTNVSWVDAQVFCSWAKARLPTEAEWEKAARGGLADSNEGRIYPWGNDWDPLKANVSHGDGGNPSPVGNFSIAGDSPYGVADMAGNVAEWVADWYDPKYYLVSPPKNPTGPNLPATDVLARRVYRGGSFADTEFDARVSARTGYPPTFRSPQIGFRCAQ